MNTTVAPELNAKAIVLGWLAAMGGSLISAFLLGVAVGLSVGPSDSELDAALGSESVSAIYGGIGMLWIFVGGAIAARLAPGSEVANAAAVGAATLFPGIFASLFVPLPPDFILVALMTVPVGALGGFCVKRRRATAVARRLGSGSLN
jgi:hypothetical protein